MKGHILIKDKVEFVPDGLPKPKHLTCGDRKNDIIHYQSEMKAYEASKKTVEVSNWVTIDIPDKNCSLLLKKTDLVGEYVWDGQKCEAEVTDTAIITKLL